MSSNLSKKVSKRFQHYKTIDLRAKILYTIILCGWVIAAFFASQITISFLSQALGLSKDNTENLVLLQLTITAIAYVFSAIFVIGIPWALGWQLQKQIRSRLGINKKPIFDDTWRALLGYGVYFFLTISATLLISIIWKGLQLDEQQNVGFGNLSQLNEYIMAFIALAIIPPIAEELLFRGYLFGELRQKISFIPSMILTSLIFAIVHLQLNVGIDVFCLSLVLCYLREKTGAIWAGVLLHMIKNSIAFYLIFVRPELLQMLR
jgi:membrane protease YdiL (CAAX protease family)